MSDEQYRHAQFLTQPVENVEDLSLYRDVKGGRGFVCDQQFGRTDQSHRDDDTLTKTTGEFEGILIEPFGGPRHVDHLQYLEGTLAGLVVARAPMDPQSFTDLSTDLRRGVERTHRVLGNEGDLISALGLHFLFRERRQVDPVELDTAPRDPTVPGQEAHDGETCRRLATARFTDETDAFARGDVQ